MGDEPPGSTSSDSPPPASPPVLRSDSVHGSPPANSAWTKKQGDAVLPVIDVVDGVASMTIPDEIFEDPNPLWKSFVVGYFIGDAPHVGSIHATVNRIWSSPRNGSKIDVQFIEKKMVLFRIENPQMRARVIQRKYWHVADVPLVVHEWSPETAMNPPDLSAMPMWVDLKGVPNSLFSHKGLKCLARAAGTFVKLHPNTEKCTRLDVARILVEVDLNKPLVERISYSDNVGALVVLEVSYPWLPPKCEVCRKWGHKGSECSAKNVTILQHNKEADLQLVVVTEDQGVQKNPVSDLIQELEEFVPYAPLGNGVEVNNMLNSIVLGAGMVEVGQSGKTPVAESRLLEGGDGILVELGKSLVSQVAGGGKVDSGAITVSPSRFHVLADIAEEGESDNEVQTDTEEGEIVADTTGQSIADHSQRQRKNSTVQLRASHNAASTVKTSKKKIVRTRDLKFAQVHASSKKASVRKL